MSDFGINEMQEMQKRLQNKYKNIWNQSHQKMAKINYYG